MKRAGRVTPDAPQFTGLLLALACAAAAAGSCLPATAPTGFDLSLVLAANFGGQSIVLRGSDPDGDPLTYTVVSGPSHGLIAGTPPLLSYSGLR